MNTNLYKLIFLYIFMTKTTLDLNMEEEGWKKYTEVSGSNGVIVGGIDLIATMRANHIPFQIKSDPEVPSTSIRSLYVSTKEYDRLCEIVEKHSE